MALKTRLVSFIWGFAEATFFFFVPDVWLSRIVLTNPREAYINIAIATLGAITGGAVMYYLGAQYFAQIEAALPLVPAVSTDMVDKVGADIGAHSLLYAMSQGMFAGVPYKIYASWAGHLSAPLLVFIVATIIARMARFITVTALAHLIRKALKKRLSQSVILRIHIGAWVCFYVFYFYTMGI